MAGSPSEGKQVQNTNSTTSSTNTAGPNPVIAPGLEDMTKSLLDWYGKNKTAPGFYPGSTVAAPSPAQQAARNSTWGFATGGLNSLDDQYAPTVDYLRNAAGGKFLDLRSNPYFQDAMRTSLEPVTENFENNTVPGLRAQFAGSGRAGAGLDSQRLSQAYLDFARASAGAATQAGNQAYGVERGLQSNAATALPGVLGQKAAQGSAYLNLMGGIGAADTAYDQRLVDADMQNYIYNTTAQPEWYAKFAQYLQAMYPGGQTVGSGTSSGTTTGTSTQSAGNAGASQFIGPALGAIGTVAMVY